MGRPVVLSNGQVFVGLDENGLVHDFYYPYVGLENLANARSSQHKIGVWVDGEFKWTDDGTWQIKVDFEVEALISHIKLTSESLKIELLLQDYVDKVSNSLIRHITITNRDTREHNVRLFMHQVFQISRAGRADTALYVPDGNYILDYKGRYCLLIAGKWDDGEQFDQYAVGSYGVEGKAGTYLDAEDGELSGNAVEHGGVDSVIRFNKNIRSGASAILDYWVIAASSQNDVQSAHLQFNRLDMEEHMHETRMLWLDWLTKTGVNIPTFNKTELEKSLLVIKAHCDVRGSILASGDSSIFNYGRDYYCYCWPRDASYALWPMLRLGHFEEAKLFFDFARDTMHKDGYLMHKYQPDRAIGSTWHPLIHGRTSELAIQEDETASVVFIMGEYYETTKDKTLVENFYHTFIVPAANFMKSFIDEQTGLPHASYDLWEEKFLTTTYTVCVVIAALEAASKLAEVAEQPADGIKWQEAADSIRANLDKLYSRELGHFVKGFLLQPDGKIEYDNMLDISSLYGPYMYAGLDLEDPRLKSTAAAVEKKLTNVTPSGGVLRYEKDFYFLSKQQYQGNPWIVCTLWLAQYYVTTQQIDKAKEMLNWALARQASSGALSEQFDPETGASMGVTPLVWSHAEMVNTILDLSRFE